MYNKIYTHQIVDLLKTFSKKELMWFGKFLNSPYFNNRKRILNLYNVLRRHYPEFDKRNFTKADLYKQLYGDKSFNDSTLRNLMSDLLQLALDFLKQEGIEKDKMGSSFFLTHELVRKGEYKLFRSKMNSLEKTILNNTTMDGDYYFHRYRINT